MQLMSRTHLTTHCGEEYNKQTSEKMFGFHVALCLAVTGTMITGLNLSNGDARCSPQKPCNIGQGDCDSDQDCGNGLFCGKNNCRGEFGYTPNGDRKDDCCTDNLNFCSPADLLPRSRTTCCSPDKPCSVGHGDCDTDNDCQSGLKCGSNNCKKFHPFADETDDCCFDPNPAPVKPNAAGDSQCSPQKPCGLGQGDCENHGDCGRGLYCGKNNCWGEFGTFVQGDRKDDCCTDNLDYCSPADLIPDSRTTCCSPDSPCPVGHGDCDTDKDCESGLKCGNNNCKKFHPFDAEETDDCCFNPNPAPIKPRKPSWRFCSLQNLCGVGEGDCAGDDTCAGGLVCGSNNCRKFHPTAHPKMDCCVQNI